MKLLMPSVRREVLLPVDPERAWELITDPDELEGWLADEVMLEPELGGEVRVEFENGEVRQGVVEGVEEARRLVFRWSGERAGGAEPGDAWNDSLVEWTLVPEPDGTRFVVVERSLSPVVGPRMSALAAQASLCLA
jgi:uncharacterized protein YndB with AHSA1/START domain